MRTLWLMYKIDVKLSIREFSGVLFGVLVPIGLIILLGIIYGDDEYAASQIGIAFGAVGTLGIASAGLMGLPITLSDYRQRKILKRYKVTPISPMTLLMSGVLLCFSLSIASMALIYVISTTMFGFVMQGSWPTFISVYLFVMVSIHAIGMKVASLAPNAQIAGVIASAIYFPMIFLSGATIPLEIMPGAMQTLSNFLPLTHGITLLQTVSLGQPLTDSMFSFLVLGIIVVLGSAISLKAFRWE